MVGKSVDPCQRIARAARNRLTAQGAALDRCASTSDLDAVDDLTFPRRGWPMLRRKVGLADETVNESIDVQRPPIHELVQSGTEVATNRQRRSWPPRALASSHDKRKPQDRLCLLNPSLCMARAKRC